ncbi:LegC family aminotransferase [Jeongeupia naejangsanensis]|uniref:LegC family aminotransferase n=1 Tax=Jeongeupia naejangsanensis TaxID=613195 RepID=A0ABS2BPQ8_9NEIS|nr:LegC family aminotransferase [Jeongeupia naejangsanensis]MBM3117400.1 LegC family aminotransferase [Jeongeupia naejangsanensis]
MSAPVSPRLEALVDFARELYGSADFIPLHAPRFAGNEKQYLLDCIDSTFVSSVGAYVDCFEAMMREITGAQYAVATMNGTAALHMALILAGVTDGDEVITQPLTFVATCNAISYQRAHPVFVDVDRLTLGLSPAALSDFLSEHAERRDAGCYNRTSGRRIAACVPMHTFGLPCDVDALNTICAEWGIALIEDAAESLGSYVGERHTGAIGRLGAFSFNGNKTVTCGGGGCIVTNDERLGKLGKHLTTTAKQAHPWAFSHDQVGYNYRLPNLNAALACAQLEQLPDILANKRETAARYATFCAANDVKFVAEPSGTRSNYWLNAVLLEDEAERDAFLAYSNGLGVMTRPVWQLMQTMPAFALAQCGPLPNAEWLAERLVNLPSSVRL